MPKPKKGKQPSAPKVDPSKPQEELIVNEVKRLNGAGTTKINSIAIVIKKLIDSGYTFSGYHMHLIMDEVKNAKYRWFTVGGTSLPKPIIDKLIMTELQTRNDGAMSRQGAMASAVRKLVETEHRINATNVQKIFEVAEKVKYPWPGEGKG